MSRTFLAALTLTLAAGLALPAQAAVRAASFGVGIRILAPSAAALGAPQLPMPADSRSLATSGATRFDVVNGGVDATRDYFLATLPAAGYSLQTQAQDSGRWQSLWRSAPGACTEIVAEPVVGAPVARVQSRSVACA